MYLTLNILLKKIFNLNNRVFLILKVTIRFHPFCQGHPCLVSLIGFIEPFLNEKDKNVSLIVY